MAWMDRNWELDPKEDAKRMARVHPAPKTAANQKVTRVGIALGVLSGVLLVGVVVVVALIVL